MIDGNEQLPTVSFYGFEITLGVSQFLTSEPSPVPKSETGKTQSCFRDPKGKNRFQQKVVVLFGGPGRARDPARQFSVI